MCDSANNTDKQQASGNPAEDSASDGPGEHAGTAPECKGPNGEGSGQPPLAPGKDAVWRELDRFVKEQCSAKPAGASQEGAGTRIANPAEQLLEACCRARAENLPGWRELEARAETGDCDPAFGRKLAAARARRALLEGTALHLAFCAEAYGLALALLEAAPLAGAFAPAIFGDMNREAFAQLDAGLANKLFADLHSFQRAPIKQKAPRFYPLHAAARAEDLAFAELFLIYGGAPGGRDDQGRVPLSYARSSRMICMLKQSGGAAKSDPCELLRQALAEDNFALAAWAVREGALYGADANAAEREAQAKAAEMFSRRAAAAEQREAARSRARELQEEHTARSAK